MARRTPLSGTSSPIALMASPKSSRSSPFLMTSQGRADEFDAEAVEGAVLGERHREVQPGLPAEGGEKGVGALLLDDLGDELGGDRLDVGAVGELGVGHDRGRVRVDEDDLVAVLLQHLARLAPE